MYQVRIEQLKTALGEQSDEVSQRLLSALEEQGEDQQVELMAETAQELDAVARLMTKVEDDIRLHADEARPQEIINHRFYRPERDMGLVRVLQELQLRAFGKTVVVERLRDGERRRWRITQANWGYPEIGVLNRQSPMATHLVSAEVGDILELPPTKAAEEWRVVEVALLERFTGPFLSGRYDDFRLMELEIDAHGRLEVVRALRDSLTQWQARCREFLQDQAEAPVLPRTVDPQQQPLTARDKAALGARFYTRTTVDQETIITGSPAQGLVAVTGVAGSGKTSVALGRTKALCDRRYDQDEATRDTFYAPETAVGYVFSTQLIEYLEKTRNELHLSAMQVQEFKELRQEQLHRHQAVLELATDFRAGSRTPRGYRQVQVKSQGPQGTMAWLQAADRAMARLFADRLMSHARRPWQFKKPLGEDRQAVFEAYWAEALDALSRLASRLESRPAPGARFHLEGLVKALVELRSTLADQLKGQGLWYRVPDQPWQRADRPADIVATLMRRGYEMGERLEQDDTSATIQLRRSMQRQLDFVMERLAVVGVREVNARVTVAFHPSGDMDADRAAIARYLEAGRLYRRKDDRWLRVTYEEDRLIRALAEGKAYVRTPQDDQWQPVRVQPPLTAKAGQPGEVLLERFTQVIRRTLKLSTAYRMVLRQGWLETALEADNIVDRESVVAAARQRLAKRQVCDADLDLLLGLLYLITLGYKPASRQLLPEFQQGPFHTTVFIDEVQDFTEIQVFLMAAQADPARRAVTVVGDLCQQLHPHRLQDLEASFPWDTVHPVFLAQNKRQRPVLADFSLWFRLSVLEDQIPDIEVPDLPALDEHFVAQIVSPDQVAYEVLNRVLSLPRDLSVAVILPDRRQARDLEEQLHEPLLEAFRESRFSEANELCHPYFVHFTTALPAKGLEFDAVIVVDFPAYDLTDSLQANAAYVALSRPRSHLYILGDERLAEGPIGALLQP